MCVCVCHSFCWKSPASVSQRHSSSTDMYTTPSLAHEWRTSVGAAVTPSSHTATTSHHMEDSSEVVGNTNSKVPAPTSAHDTRVWAARVREWSSDDITCKQCIQPYYALLQAATTTTSANTTESASECVSEGVSGVVLNGVRGEWRVTSTGEDGFTATCTVDAGSTSTACVSDSVASNSSARTFSVASLKVSSGAVSVGSMLGLIRTASLALHTAPEALRVSKPKHLTRSAVPLPLPLPLRVSSAVVAWPVLARSALRMMSLTRHGGTTPAVSSAVVQSPTPPVRYSLLQDVCGSVRVNMHR